MALTYRVTLRKLIEAEDLEDAIGQVSEGLVGIHDLSIVLVDAGPIEAELIEPKPKAKKPKAPKAPKAAKAPKAQPAPEPAPDDNGVSADDFYQALTEYAVIHGNAGVLQLLASHGHKRVKEVVDPEVQRAILEQIRGS